MCDVIHRYLYLAAPGSLWLSYYYGHTYYGHAYHGYTDHGYTHYGRLQRTQLLGGGRVACVLSGDERREPPVRVSVRMRVRVRVRVRVKGEGE
eukprot:scaffold29514_cov56-Phaeocystis_antarctica.AAC.1